MKHLEVFKGRVSSHRMGVYEAEFDGAVPFSTQALCNQFNRIGLYTRQLSGDMTVHEAHAVFVDVFGEGISPDELTEAAERYAKKENPSSNDLAACLTDAYARDYAKNASLSRQMYDATKWYGILGLDALGRVLVDVIGAGIIKYGSKVRKKINAATESVKDYLKNSHEKARSWRGLFDRPRPFNERER